MIIIIQASYPKTTHPLRYDNSIHAYSIRSAYGERDSKSDRERERE